MTWYLVAYVIKLALSSFHFLPAGSHLVEEMGYQEESKFLKRERESPGQYFLPFVKVPVLRARL